MDCLGTYFTHVHTCNVTRVQSATEWTASVGTLHMLTPVMQPVLKALQWTPSVQSTTPYYKVLLQYYSVQQSTTPVLFGTTKYYGSTTPYYKVLRQYYSVLLQYYSILQSTTPLLLRTTKYYASTTL